MRKLIFLPILLLICVSSAQNFKGEAYYVKKINIKVDADNEEDLKKQMVSFVTNNMKKSLEKTYVLTFAKNESTYKEEEKLDEINSIVSVSDNVSNLYKNLKTKQYYQTKELLGKIFLIKDSLSTYNWELKSETKKIGEYLCHKAVLRNEDVTSEEPKLEVWYTLNIPISNGPEELWGLPGLILEVKEGNIQLLCTKIILNKDVKIKVPRRGKKINKKEYEVIEKEKLEEFKKKYNLKN